MLNDIHISREVSQMDNKLIGVGYTSSKKDGFWWLTIYRDLVEEFENIVGFINEYIEETDTSTP